MKDISVTGAYLSGSIAWPIGTSIIGVIRQDGHGSETMVQLPALSIAFRVVRYGPDGIGICFDPRSRKDEAALGILVKRIAAGSRGAVS